MSSPSLANDSSSKTLKQESHISERQTYFLGMYIHYHPPMLAASSNFL